MSEFKDMLKFFRMKYNLSQSELADKLGLSASTISMYEVGRREPDFETEEKIADFFNTDLNTLRGRDIESAAKSPEPKQGYYLNDETAAIAQEIFENKELRALFDVQCDMDPDDLKALHNMALALKRKERGNDDT